MFLSTAEPPSAKENNQYIVATRIVLSLAAAYLFLRSAWLSDDAFISLRQVEMFVTGEGMVWNLGERVQAFTHPTWFMVLSLGRLVSGSLYYMTIVVSAFCIAGTLWIFWQTCRRSGHHPIAVLALMALPVLSIPFRDYMTSGLENPLSFLLVAVVFALLARLESRRARRLLWIVLALAILNRQDLVLQLGPLALWLLVRRDTKSEIIVAAPGIVLLVAWFAFATFYFGAPLPNTYFAKLSAGIPQENLYAFGLQFLIINIGEYPFTAAAILGGIIFGLAGKTPDKLIAAGIILHLIYLLRIGGDFMLGRFLTIDFVLACFILARVSNGMPKSFSIMTGMMAVAGLLLEPAFWVKTRLDASTFNIVSDERQFYYHDYGLLSPFRQWPRREAGETKSREIKYVAIACGLIGGARIRWPDTIFLVDDCGLTDPFLSRLPVADSVVLYIRPGHYIRNVPANYGNVIMGAEAALPDAASRGLWDDVQLVARAPLLDPARLSAVWRLATGRHKFALDNWTHPEKAGYKIFQGKLWLTPEPERKYLLPPSEAYQKFLHMPKISAGDLQAKTGSLTIKAWKAR